MESIYLQETYARNLIEDELDILLNKMDLYFEEDGDDLLRECFLELCEKAEDYKGCLREEQISRLIIMSYFCGCEKWLIKYLPEVQLFLERETDETQFSRLLLQEKSLTYTVTRLCLSDYVAKGRMPIFGWRKEEEAHIRKRAREVKLPVVTEIVVQHKLEQLCAESGQALEVLPVWYVLEDDRYMKLLVWYCRHCEQYFLLTKDCKRYEAYMPANMPEGMLFEKIRRDRRHNILHLPREEEPTVEMRPIEEISLRAEEETRRGAEQEKIEQVYREIIQAYLKEDEKRLMQNFEFVMEDAACYEAYLTKAQKGILLAIGGIYEYDEKLLGYLASIRKLLVEEDACSSFYRQMKWEKSLPLLSVVKRVGNHEGVWMSLVNGIDKNNRSAIIYKLREDMMPIATAFIVENEVPKYCREDGERLNSKAIWLKYEGDIYIKVQVKYCLNCKSIYLSKDEATRLSERVLYEL